MKYFTKTLKLYHRLNRKLLTLSVQSSPTYVLTFFIKEDQFSRMRSEYNSEEGYSDSEFFVLQKKDYIRFTKFGNGMEHNLRIPIDKWEALLKNHRDLREVTEGDLITCEID